MQRCSSQDAQGCEEGGVSEDSALKDGEQSQADGMPLCPRDGGKVRVRVFHLQMERENWGLCLSA